MMCRQHQTHNTHLGSGSIRTAARRPGVLLVGVDLEEVEELVGAHGLERGVFLRDDGVGNVDLEFLQAHNLLLERAAGDEAVDVDRALLANAVGAVHGLQILHRVPVVLEEDDRVGAGEVEPEPADVSGQQHEVDARVLVEGRHHLVALALVRLAVHPRVGHAGHVHTQQVRLQHVQHARALGKDERPVLVDSLLHFAKGITATPATAARLVLTTVAAANAAVQQQLAQSRELGRVADVAQRRVLRRQLGRDARVLRVLGRHHQRRMVADALEILQGLEDVAAQLAALALPAASSHRLAALGVGKRVVEAGLQRAEVAVVVLDNLGR